MKKLKNEKKFYHRKHMIDKHRLHSLLLQQTKIEKIQNEKLNRNKFE